MDSAVEDVVIVGAGIAGLATAVALKRAGIEALVLEKSEALRATGGGLILFSNAWSALDALGINLTTRCGPPLLTKGYATDLDTGDVQEVSRPTTHGNRVGPRAVHRKALLEALADELPIHSIRFSSSVSTIETQQHDDGSSLVLVHIGNRNTVKSKVLIGCDGLHSIVSRWLGLGEPVYSGHSAVRGLAVYSLHGHGNESINHRMQYAGRGMRAGFAPLTAKEIHWFFSYTTPAKGERRVEDPKEILEKYGKGLPPLYLDLVRHSDCSTLTWAPLKFRYPWHVAFGNLSKQNVTVAGDAMHPMTPELGQGGCSALEDAVALGRHIGKSFVQNGRVIVPEKIAGAIDKYVQERKWRVALLIVGSYFSGWVQHAGSSGWGMKFLRDVIYHKFFYPIIVKYVHCVDCEKLEF